jgi:competence protein ComEC
LIQMLWPDETIPQTNELSDNDSSLVCLIEFADRRILLCSDIEEFAQRELLHLNPEPRADIVIAPHHGSGKNLWSEFVKNLEPEILICSCNQRQYERQQAIKSQKNTKAFYTATDGTITIRINKNGLITANTFVRPN